MKDLAQRAWICFRKFHNLIGNEIYESFFLVWLMSLQPLSTVKRDLCFGQFQTNSILFLNPEYSILIDVKTNRNGFRSSGQDILAWRVQIPEVELFDGFQFHVNSGILGSLDISRLSHVDPYFLVSLSIFREFGFLL